VPVTVIIAARNEERNIGSTIHYISKQDYEGEIQVIVVDNGSTDETVARAKKAGAELKLNIRVLLEEETGKFHALNRGISETNSGYVLTLDADTLLHKSAIRYIVARMVSSPEDVCAVAGTILARNSRENLLTKMQEWDYFLGIAAIKRLQGLYQGTLVAQGAFSLYKTEAVKEIGGWPEAIGEDIVLTWRFLHRNYRVYFEPLAVAFTEVPSTFRHFAKQRSRWARGMSFKGNEALASAGSVRQIFDGHKLYHAIPGFYIHSFLDSGTYSRFFWLLLDRRTDDLICSPDYLNQLFQHLLLPEKSLQGA
jgi:biofilm PGA synthesis N-glycosyltransferase PgaC